MAVSSHLFIEERNNSWNTPYLFNAKELDEETGLYYYGARYYNPRTSVWLSTDPLQEKYPNKTPYHYCSQNPVNMIDPDGRDDIFTREGTFVRSTKVGSDILIEMGSSYEVGTTYMYLKAFNHSDGAMPTINSKEIVTNVISHYAKDLGINFVDGNGRLGLEVHPDPDKAESNIAWADNYFNISFNIEGGYIDDLMNNKYNLMSTLIHENTHRNQFLRGDGSMSVAKMELEAITAQMTDSSWKKTTKDFQGSMLRYLKDNLSKRISEGLNDSMVGDFLDVVNTNNSNYKMSYRRTGGDPSSFDLKIIEVKK